MWRETKILLIDDDSARRRDLAVVLNFLGEENLACSSQDWQQVVEPLSSSREVLCVLIGTVNAPGSVLGLVKTVAGWDEFLPVLLLGEISSAEGLDKSINLVVKGAYRNEVSFEVKEVNPASHLQVSLGTPMSIGSGKTIHHRLTIKIDPDVKQISRRGGNLGVPAYIVLKTTHPFVKEVSIQVLLSVTN